VSQALLPYSMQRRALDTRIKFGTRVGLMVSTLSGEYDDVTSLVSPSIGLIARKALRKRLRATGEVQYAGRGAEVYAGAFDSVEISLRYIDLSGGLQYSLGGRFYAEVGATLSVLVSDEGDSFFDADVEFEIAPADVSGDIGIGATLGSFDFRLHYKHGLIDVADVEFSGENDGVVGDEFYNRSYGFQLGYYF
jgi:hypothetical protein